MRRSRPAAWLGAPLLTAALLAGCSSDPPPPIYAASGSLGSQCLGAARGLFVTAGDYNLQNKGSAAARITGIVLPGMHDLKVTSAWLTPILRDSSGDMDEIGMGFNWPPHESKLARQEWAARVPLIGAVIRPGQNPNLSFGVARTGTRGTAGAPLVTYTSDGHDYTANEGYSIVVSAHC